MIARPPDLESAAARIDAALESILPRGGRLAEAMRYAVLAPGKRFRPFLALATGRLLGVAEAHALRAGCAVELIHAYSLIHDDLPCMDDDDMRRGRPSVHRRFDEASAVLAGDALQSLAFEVLADPAAHPDGAVRAGLVMALARAAGQAGMAGGQMLDLNGSPDIETMQRLKTGALIRVSVELPVIMAGADGETAGRLLAYADDLGLLFQIADDLLDAEGDAAETGKATGKDAAAGKANQVTVDGVQNARRRGEALVNSAMARLETFGDRASSLRQAALFMLHRRN